MTPAARCEPDKFHPEHFERFRATLRCGVWPSRTAEGWLKDVGIVLSSDLAQAELDRDFLKRIAANSSYEDRAVLWAILCWGGMRRDHARRLKKSTEVAWCSVVKRLRKGDLTRSESYDLCAEIVRTHPRGGIGPAYFSKLIYFAHPAHNGYIMDQWTSRSVNLLLMDGPVVQMRTFNDVDPRNSSVVYERFCKIIENLAKCLSLTPEQVEMCLFSTGGLKRAAWRDYVSGITPQRVTSKVV